MCCLTTKLCQRSRSVRWKFNKICKETCDDDDATLYLLICYSHYALSKSSLGYARFQLGDYSEAITSYRAALAIEPSNTQWQNILSQCVAKEEEATVSSSRSGGSDMPDFASMLKNPGNILFRYFHRNSFSVDVMSL